MEKRINTYLAIALTTYCNYQCFYCKEGGESISKNKETIPLFELKRIVKNAYNLGIRNFRITGGEPTGVLYFGEFITYIMKFDDTKVRINTNGYKISNYIETLTQYRERIDVVFSVDSVSEYLKGVHFQKFLSENVVETTKLLRGKGISVRYNIVVTTLNESEVEKLVLISTDELNVNVKLLDLNKFSEYLGINYCVMESEAYSLWKELFVPMKKFYTFLESISNYSESEWTTPLISKGCGIPMSAYFRNENWIQVKDSMRGAKYSNFCLQECKYYKTGNCQEGVFSLFLSSNMVLHLSGCKNNTIHYNLHNQDNEKIKECIKKLLELI